MTSFHGRNLWATKGWMIVFGRAMPGELDEDLTIDPSGMGTPQVSDPSFIWIFRSNPRFLMVNHSF